MKKFNRIVWMLILSISPTLSMENDKDSTVQRKVLSRTQIWQNGKKISETITYDPQAQEPIRPSGRGAWDNPNWQPTELTPYIYTQDGYW